MNTLFLLLLSYRNDCEWSGLLFWIGKIIDLYCEQKVSKKGNNLSQLSLQNTYPWVFLSIRIWFGTFMYMRVGGIGKDGEGGGEVERSPGIFWLLNEKRIFTWKTQKIIRTNTSKPTLKVYLWNSKLENLKMWNINFFSLFFLDPSIESEYR